MYAIMNCGLSLARRCVIAVLCAVGLAACQTTTGPDEAVRFFNDVAFRGSPGGHPMSGSILIQSGFADHPLVRWETPVFVRLEGEVTTDREAQVKRLFSDFNRLTGVEYTWVDGVDRRTNFVVHFESEEGFLINNVEYVPCYASSAHLNGMLSNVDIKISLKKPKLVPHCIAHELAHGFGFAHSNVLPSVVSPNERLVAFSRWDELAMKTLYDDRLQAGMTRTEALPIARQIILDHLGGRS
jgi:hypothetical protein